VVGGSVVIELTALNGRSRWLGETPLHRLLAY